MTDPSITVFRDDVVRHLQTSIVPEIPNEYQQFLNCEVRPLDEHDVQIKDLQFIRRNTNGDLELVNDDLRSDRLVLEFQYRSDVEWETWNDLLSQFTVTTDCHHLRTPYTVKWENTETSGRLKADERFDEQEYIRRRIGARKAVGTAIEVILHDYLPREVAQLSRSTDEPHLIQRIYNDRSDSIERLRRTRE